MFCNSRSDLQTLTSERTLCRSNVHKLLPQLAIAHDRYLVVCFLLVPSHVGLAANELVDNLAKIVCALEIPDLHATPSLRHYRKKNIPNIMP